jgi:hypothetical protein
MYYSQEIDNFEKSGHVISMFASNYIKLQHIAATHLICGGRVLS